MKKNSSMPKKEGWYMVQLTPGYMGDERPYDVDYCRPSNDPENPGMEWDIHPHRVVAWAEMSNG